MDKKTDDFQEEDMISEEENYIPYQNPTISANDAVRLHEGCPVCGNKMHFTNFTDFARLVSHEVVRCDDCGYRAKRDMTHLQ
jgi:predicted RNA-binding Zn-ribbon protein involved in translation (DUF1610 family)